MPTVRSRVGTQTVKARVGTQNVVRVVSSVGTPPAKLINLSDVNSTYRTSDGMILVWDLPSQSFIMTSFIDSSSTTIEGIAYFTNTDDSTSTTTGALIVSGGVGISKNLNVGGNLEITGISTFSSDLDINAAVNILNELVVSGNTQLSGITTFTDTTDNELGNVNSGSVQFDGGIGIEKNLTVGGGIHIEQDLVVTGDLTVDGTQTVINTQILEVEDINIGIASVVPKLNDSQLDGAGITIHGLDGDKSLTWDNSNSRLAFNTDVYAPNYYAGNFDGPNGVAYFDDNGKLVGAASTESLLSTSYYILTIEQSSGVPKWTSTIDGGEY